MKKRIIPSLLLNQGTNVCLSKQFSPWRTIGALTQNLRLHVQRSADELLIINLNCAGNPETVISPRIFSIVRNEVDIPIAYAGGISCVDSAITCINSGFDKVFVTSMLLDKPTEIAEISNIIGAQSLGVCIPYKRSDGHQYLWDYRQKSLTNILLSDALRTALSVGAGEVVLYNIDSDGTLQGLDLSVIELLQALDVDVPILLAGGAGSASHFSSALAADEVQGVIAGSIFALTKDTPLTIREHCIAHGIAMRRP